MVSFINKIQRFGLTLLPANDLLRQSQHGVGRRVVHHPEKLGRFRDAFGYLHTDEVEGQLTRGKQNQFCILFLSLGPLTLANISGLSVG